MKISADNKKSFHFHRRIYIYVYIYIYIYMLVNNKQREIEKRRCESYIGFKLKKKEIAPSHN